MSDTLQLGETEIPAPEAEPPKRRSRLALFAFLYRNAARAIDRFNLPPKSVIELSREIEI